MVATRVLIIDDSEADHFIAQLRLQDVEPDVQITRAFDGVEAMEILRSRGESAFDLILVDVNMPRMNGHAFLEAYYAQTRATPPRVVVLTSSANAADRQRCERFACVSDYQTKPLDPAWVRRALS